MVIWTYLNMQRKIKQSSVEDKMWRLRLLYLKMSPSFLKDLNSTSQLVSKIMLRAHYAIFSIKYKPLFDSWIGCPELFWAGNWMCPQGFIFCVIMPFCCHKPGKLTSYLALQLFLYCQRPVVRAATSSHWQLCAFLMVRVDLPPRPKHTALGMHCAMRWQEMKQGFH